MTSYIDPRALIKARYGELSVDRDLFVDRSFDYAAVTIPSLMPERTHVGGSGTTEAQAETHDYNTEGAKLLNNLANHYMQTMFPAGRSFVRLRLEEADMQLQIDGGRSRGDIEQAFTAAERDMRQRFEDSGSRAALLDGLKHLIVTGNCCPYKPADGKLQIYALDEYVVNRALDGTILEIITEDQKSLSTLEPGLRAAVQAELDIKDEEINTRMVTLYTQVIKASSVQAAHKTAEIMAADDDAWVVRQAVEAQPVGDEFILSPDKMRWMPQVWERTRREAYGRGLVEHHFNSFWTLSILTEALTLGAVTMADVKYLVRPGSLLDVLSLNASASGTYHYGEPDDVTTIQRNNSNDMRLVTEVIEMYKRHLGEVFMHLPSQMRNAERVTAEENRLRAMALEQAHGGVFSQLAESLQEPLARLILAEMNVTGLKEAGVQLSIVAGFDALARNQENEKILQWLNDLTVANTIPEEARNRIKWEDFMKITASGRDVDYKAFLMTEDEYNQRLERQQQAQERMMSKEAFTKNADPEQLARTMGQQ